MHMAVLYTCRVGFAFVKNILLTCSGELWQIKVVQRAEGGGFPGLYCSNLIANPWLTDSSTLLLSSAWRSQQVILGINVERLAIVSIS